MRPGEVGNASVAARQVRQNLPARGIGQRGKSSVQRSRRIFNHLVNYLAASLQRANIFFLRFAAAGDCIGASAKQRIQQVTRRRVHSSPVTRHLSLS